MAPAASATASLSNKIFANGHLGIDLVDGGNLLQPAPVLTSLSTITGHRGRHPGHAQQHARHDLLDSVFP